MSSCKQNKLTSSLVIHQIGKCGSQPERGLTPPGEAAATANTFQLTQHKSDRSIQSINTISKKKKQQQKTETVENVIKVGNGNCAGGNDPLNREKWKPKWKESAIYKIYGT